MRNQFVRQNSTRVPNVMAARLTRWQVVMEDAYRGRASGAPGNARNTRAAAAPHSRGTSHWCQRRTLSSGNLMRNLRTRGNVSCDVGLMRPQLAARRRA